MSEFGSPATWFSGPDDIPFGSPEEASDYIRMLCGPAAPSDESEIASEATPAAQIKDLSADEQS